MKLLQGIGTYKRKGNLLFQVDCRGKKRTQKHKKRVRSYCTTIGTEREEVIIMKYTATENIETVYTEAEWCKHMESNGRKIFLRWLTRKAKEITVVVLALVVLLAFVTVAGILADAIVAL